MVIKSQTFTFYVSYIRIYISDLLITVRNVVPQGYVFTGVCDSVHRGGEGVHGRGVCMAGGMHGGGMHGGGGVWWGHAWQEQWPLQWTVCTLLECILVVPGRHPSWADPPRQIPHPPGRPPPPRYYGIRSTSGRNASYWNAYL